MEKNNINKLIKIVDSKGKPVKDILVANSMELQDCKIQYRNKTYQLQSSIDKIDDFGIFSREYTFKALVAGNGEDFNDFAEEFKKR
jgi:hypothetical protein